jgi:hypothetical protein
MMALVPCCAVMRAVPPVPVGTRLIATEAGSHRALRLSCIMPLLQQWLAMQANHHWHALHSGIPDWPLICTLTAP